MSKELKKVENNLKAVGLTLAQAGLTATNRLYLIPGISRKSVSMIREINRVITVIYPNGKEVLYHMPDGYSEDQEIFK